MFLLSSEHIFPPIALADEFGIVAVGGDLDPKRLLAAYQQGIFPWYNEGEPILWHSPHWRMVLFPNEIYISKSMRKILRDGTFKVTFNQNFEAVVRNCKTIERPGQEGTWLNNELEESLIALHKQGHAKSVEVWQDDQLVGGLYGLDLGHVFCGESMFSHVSNASKVAFIWLAQKLEKEKYQILDCQVYNEHLASLGAVEIPQSEFKEILGNKSFG